MTLPPLPRKLVLLLHVLTAVGAIGAVGAFLALAVAGAQGMGGAYAAMRLVAWWVLIPLVYASLLVGLLSSLGTPWGIVRHWWVIAKLVLTLVAVIVLQLQTRTIDALAAAEASGTLGAMHEAQAAMLLHSGGGLAVLVVATLLSVLKPRGITRYALKTP